MPAAYPAPLSPIAQHPAAQGCQKLRDSGDSAVTAPCQRVPARCAGAARPAPQPDAMTYAIEAEGLTKRFGNETTGTLALAGIDLAAREGTVLGVLGPNGAGKTTAVRILATLLRANSGRASVGGYDVAKNAVAVRGLIVLT